MLRQLTTKARLQTSGGEASPVESCELWRRAWEWQHFTQCNSNGCNLYHMNCPTRVTCSAHAPRYPLILGHRKIAPFPALFAKLDVEFTTQVALCSRLRQAGSERRTCGCCFLLRKLPNQALFLTHDKLAEAGGSARFKKVGLVSLLPQGLQAARAWSRLVCCWKSGTLQAPAIRRGSS